jgi:hypothetical protein
LIGAARATTRSASRAAYAAWMGSVVRWRPAPRVLVNSVPKAGTHLVVGALSRLPKMTYAGVHVQPETLARVSGAPIATGESVVSLRMARTQLAGIRNGQYATAHLPAWPGFEAALGDLGFRVLLVVRDPRDIAVSFAFYATKLETHHLHRRFRALDSDEDRIRASITGLPATGDSPELLPIDERVGAFLPWTSAADVKVVRFEDLIGARGGGSRETQIATVSEIAEFVVRPLDATGAQRVADAVWTTSSTTFRRGVSGGWRDHFTPALTDLFKRTGGQLLVDMGYERDQSW